MCASASTKWFKTIVNLKGSILFTWCLTLGFSVFWNIYIDTLFFGFHTWLYIVCFTFYNVFKFTSQADEPTVFTSICLEYLLSYSFLIHSCPIFRSSQLYTIRTTESSSTANTICAGLVNWLRLSGFTFYDL